MYHSITFGVLRGSEIVNSKNTFKDLLIAPDGRPIFTMPEPKTNFVDIPGADGSIDQSEVLTGYPIYNNREGSFTFYLLRGTYKMHDHISMISDYLHGKQMYAVLEDDPGYYYLGRFWVSDVSEPSDGSIPSIEISYNVQPYKRSLFTSVDNWLWDPFSFRDGVVLSNLFKGLKTEHCNVSALYTFTSRDVGKMPNVPEFNVEYLPCDHDNNCTLTFSNPELGIENKTIKLQNGLNVHPEIILSGHDPFNEIRMEFTGHANIDVVFRPGRL